MNSGGFAPKRVPEQTIALVGVLVLAIGLTGCGNKLAQVTGVVTIDGQPLRGGDEVRATVTFQPASNVGTAAVGLVDENGQYQLSSGSQDGVTPGEYLVTCSASQLVRGKDGGAGGARRLTDPSYASSKTSGLKFTVAPGKNEFNLALNSRVGNRPAGRTP